MKESVSHQAPKVIKKLQFSLLNAQDTVKYAEFEVTHRDLYTHNERLPVKDGVLDRRLGTTEKNAFCETCGQATIDCVGHYAYIKLVVPVFHIGYFKHTIGILQCICKTCARVLLEEPDRRNFIKRFRRPNLENMQRQALTKAVNTMSRKTVYCPYCSATNGAVKKAGALKIIHDKFRAKKTAEEMEKWKKSFAPALEEQKDLALYLNKAVHEDLNPLKVLDLFKRISDEDCELLGMQPKFGRPEEFIWQYISVPPVCIRPSVAQDGGSNEDDLTVKLTEIVFTNAVIKQGLARGVPTPQFMEQWDLLQLSVAMYINSELPGVPSQMGLKPIRGFVQRLKGKQGRFRGNLSGKRVDFSGRTVISPDPNLRIDEVAVPQRVAQILTYPERVTSHNIEALQQAVRNGPEIHPGANFVSRGQNKKFLKFGNRKAIADGLAIGDIVERHIIDGDVALFNRQPSLHKLSIMCHRVKVRPWRTFRLNECVCGPYNADFDGDEMNLHIPQTEEARTEALELMNIKHNLVTPRNGEPVIAAIQDFITASYLLSRKDQFFDRRQITQICCYMADANLQIDIPPPTILKPVRLWTGKQIFSVLMRPNRKSKIMVNVESKCHRWEEAKPENYPDRMKLAKDMSPNDGWLVIVNSEVMCGVMDKAIVGSGKKKSIFGVIMRDYGPHEAAAAMNRLAKLCARWLANYGFSLGINDVIPGPELSTKKDGLVEEAYAHCQRLITKAKNGELENKPGCDQEQTLEAEISSVLSKVREAVGQICMKELSRQNAPLIMATCGSKGSVINVSQMVACVGQQIIAGHRVPNGFQDRSLPHFPKHSKEPPSKGFVRNSFYSGLVATEFLFHAISGREGLVDTAVKTAETGYMQRRLMKALEDLTTQYDLSVRNSTGGVVQFRYGDDGLDPACLEGDAQPLDLDRAWQYATATSRVGAPLLPFQIIDLVDTELGTKRFTTECTPTYVDSLRNFLVDNVVTKLARARSDQGMYDATERSSEWDEDTDLSFGASEAAKAAVNNKVKVTTRQVKTFLDLCWVKYVKARIEPGSTVGAVGAQSIGEPGTQMTLKTFHFAGVASMNVTLGVPRIKEIINAAKAISTPIISCKLVTADSEASARIVKGRLEKTLLGDISSVLEEAWAPEYTYIGVLVDTDAIQKLQLELTLDDIKWAIVAAKKLKIKQESITIIAKKKKTRSRVTTMASGAPASSATTSSSSPTSASTTTSSSSSTTSSTTSSNTSNTSNTSSSTSASNTASSAQSSGSSLGSGSSSGTSSATKTSSSTTSTSTLTASLTTAVATTVVGTSADGQVYTTVIQTSTVLPPGATVTSSSSSDSGSSSSSDSHTGAIVGGAVGGGAALIIVLVLVGMWWKRYKQKQRSLEAFDGNFDPDRIVTEGKAMKGEPKGMRGRGATLPNVGDDDDGMGGRLAGSALGAGVVAPYPLYHPTNANAIPPEMSTQQQQQQNSNPSSTSLGYSRPSTHTRSPSLGLSSSGVPASVYAAAYGDNGPPPTQPQGSNAPYGFGVGERLPNPYTQNPNQPNPASNTGSTSTHTTHTGAGQGYGRFNVANPDPGAAAGASSSSAAGPEGLFVGGFTPGARGENKSAAGPAFGGRSRDVLVHQDGGRVDVPRGEGEGEGPDEIPPTYDSLLPDRSGSGPPQRGGKR